MLETITLYRLVLFSRADGNRAPQAALPLLCRSASLKENRIRALPTIAFAEDFTWPILCLRDPMKNASLPEPSRTREPSRLSCGCVFRVEPVWTNADAKGINIPSAGSKAAGCSEQLPRFSSTWRTPSVSSPCSSNRDPTLSSKARLNASMPSMPCCSSVRRTSNLEDKGIQKANNGSQARGRYNSVPMPCCRRC